MITSGIKSGIGRALKGLLSSLEGSLENLDAINRLLAVKERWNSRPEAPVGLAVLLLLFARAFCCSTKGGDFSKFGIGRALKVWESSLLVIFFVRLCVNLKGSGVVRGRVGGDFIFLLPLDFLKFGMGNALNCASLDSSSLFAWLRLLLTVELNLNGSGVVMLLGEINLLLPKERRLDFLKSGMGFALNFSALGFSSLLT